MKNLILQNIVDDISIDSLPISWYNYDFKSFSNKKTLFDFQQKALRNSIKAIWEYYGHTEDFSSIQKDRKEVRRKERLFRIYRNSGFFQNFDFDLNKKKEKKSTKFLLEYDKDYQIIDNKINFKYFINRMSFWMATGSGKTLIIVKLLEILHNLIEGKEIPTNDILFLAHRDDLLEQFKNHVDEFNSFHRDFKINLKDLKDYENVKRLNLLPFKDNILTVFYYRSDLISDVHKEKLVDFRNYDNNGRWYILLDEAHKGDREDSKRQILYSILSRNGFLFNFSATFTDPGDFATCVFNFNLSKFIEQGYGKHIYLSEQEVSAFRDKTIFSEIEKQKIVLKTLILFAYINKYSEKVKKIDKNFYHRPLILTLVNSVNIEDADLLLFFQELEKIGSKRINKKLFALAINEILKEYKNKPKFIFEDVELLTDSKLIAALTHDDILKYVFNSKTPGKIEVLKIPNNKKELIFKLHTADKPFASIKIGDISSWLKEKLTGYEINESYKNESVFEKINYDDSDINILMGSRSFYEGWDSNRPNLVLFVNIGIGKDAKKFVLQAIGRGVRIEPLKDKRKRIKQLYNSKEIDEYKFNKVIKNVLPLETLFIFGTNPENLKEVIATLNIEQTESLLGSEFILNKQVENKLLLIPIYRESSKILAEERHIQKFFLNEEDFELADNYFKYLGDKVVLANHNCDLKVLKKVNLSLVNPEGYYSFDSSQIILHPNLMLERIIEHFSLRQKEFDKFKELQDEIVHFKKIKYSGDEKLSEFIKKIRQVKAFDQKKVKEKQLKLEFEDDKNIDKYTKRIQHLEKDYKNEEEFEDLKIKFIISSLPIIAEVNSLPLIYFSKITISQNSNAYIILSLKSFLSYTIERPMLEPSVSGLITTGNPRALFIFSLSFITI